MSEPFERLKSIVLEATGLEGASRVAFLDRACGADVALRQDVESLLVHADDEHSVLSTAAAIRIAGPISLAGLESASDSPAPGVPAAAGIYAETLPPDDPDRRDLERALARCEAAVMRAR